MEMEPDQAFVEYVLKAMADHPESVSTTRTIDAMGVLIQANVHPEDMGKIVGKGGKTRVALSLLLHIVGMKWNARASLKILEPVGGKRQPAPEST